MISSLNPPLFPLSRLALLNSKIESRGLNAVEVITPYSYKSLPDALRRCVEVLNDEDRNALAFAVVMPPGFDIPIKIWSCVIPVDICSNEEESLDDEVADRLKRLSKLVFTRFLEWIRPDKA